ncbi:MAG TPA: hypothetical protein VFA45_06920 [Actinomycetes bacterium]|jgi:hypothetical protein|nr:hypothetical protein [Actinomycetes bacterium]
MNEWEKERTERKAGPAGAAHHVFAVIVAGACIGVAVIVAALSLVSLLR